MCIRDRPCIQFLQSESWVRSKSSDVIQWLVHSTAHSWRLSIPSFDTGAKPSTLKFSSFLQFMQSQREGNFELYISTLGRIVPWVFAVDRFHYAKWLPVHVRDLMPLQHECPAVYQEFRQGNFVTQKTIHCFSMMAHDHVHEQLNAVLKGDGGIIGITENESALKRWLIAGPEMARIILYMMLKWLYLRRKPMTTDIINKH